MRLLITFLIMGLSLSTLAQSIESLENTIENYYGKEKLELLIRLAENYIQSDPKKAVKYARQAQELSNTIITPSNTLITKEDYVLKPLSSFLLGKAYFEREQYLESKTAFTKARKEFMEIRHNLYEKELDEYLARLNVIASEDEKAVEGTFFKKKFGNLRIGEMISATTEDVAINNTLKTAEGLEKSGDYLTAIDHYQKAINLLRNEGESKKITELREHIGDLYLKASRYDDALNYYALAKQDYAKSKNQAALENVEKLIDNTITIKNAHQALPNKIERNLNAASQKIDTKIDSITLQQKNTQENLRDIARKLEQEKDFEKSLEYYKLYTELQNKYTEEERAKELALLEQERIQQEVTLLRQDQEISRLQLAQNETDLIRQKKFRNNLIMGTFLLIALAVALYFLYKNKKKDHHKLQLAYDDLDLVKSQLEKAEKKIKTLLHQQVSGAVATALMKEEFPNKIEQRFVCVMFLDIRDFTPFAETKMPEEIIQYQNDVFGFMIDIVEKHHGVINQLLGDGFMATFGAPISEGNDCENAVDAALEIIRVLQQKIENKHLPETRAGIGLHAGNVVTGNVGTEERKQFSITGNTVIIAARIEQLTKEFQSQLLISREVYEQLVNKNLNGNKFTEVNIKGRNKPIEVMSLA